MAPRNNTLLGYVSAANAGITIPLGTARVICALYWQNAYNGDQLATPDNPGAVPGSYQIEGFNGATWAQVKSVTGNHYHHRAHILTNVSGYTQLRCTVGASRFEVVSTSGNGPDDLWLLIGDSNCQNNWKWSQDFRSRVQAMAPSRCPVFLTMPAGGWQMDTPLRTTDYAGVPTIRQWMQDFEGSYVGVMLGTNDAYNGKSAAQFYTHSAAIATEIVNAGKIPMFGDVLYTPGSVGMRSLILQYQTQLANLRAAFPTAVRGAKLTDVFKWHFDQGTTGNPVFAGDAWHIWWGTTQSGEQQQSVGCGADIMEREWARAAVESVYQPRRVAGFHLSWIANAWTSPNPSLDGSGLTHAFLGRAETTPGSGALRYSYGMDATSGASFVPAATADQTRVISWVTACNASGVVPCLMIGGSGDGVATWGPATSTYRNAFCDAIISLCDQVGFRGVDLDFESGMGSGLYTNIAETAKQLKSRRPNLTVAFPIYCDGTAAPAVSSIAPEVDHYNVMTIDLVLAQTSAWYHTAVYSPSDNGTTSTRTINGIMPGVVSAFNSAGISLYKLGAQFGFYGYGWRDETGPRNNAGGPDDSEPGGHTPYAKVIRNLATQYPATNSVPTYSTLTYDAAARSTGMYGAAPAFYQGNEWFGIDDEAGVAAKCDYFDTLGIGGTIIWALNYDEFRNSGAGTTAIIRHPLIDAIKRRFLGRPPSKTPRSNAVQTFNTSAGATGTTFTISGLGKSAIWFDAQSGIGQVGFDLLAAEANIPLTNGTPMDYIIDASANGGSTWTTLVNVTGSSYQTRTHLVDLTGYNRVRMRVSAIWPGTVGHGTVDVAIHDARTHTADDWILFLGDSISDDVFKRSSSGDGADAAGNGRFGWNINQLDSTRFPIAINGGISQGRMYGCLRTRRGAFSGEDGTGSIIYPDANGYGQPLIRKWMADLSCKYVSLGIGTNDTNEMAWQAVSSGGLDTIQNRMERLIKEVIAAGKTVILPNLRWVPGVVGAPYRADWVDAWNYRLWNTVLPKYPGVIRGPDLYTNSVGRNDLLRDGLHPNSAGISITRQDWTTWAVANLYADANGTGIPPVLTLLAASPSGGTVRFFGTKTAGSTVGLYKRA